MKQQVLVDMRVMLWIDATHDEETLGRIIRHAVQDGFGDNLSDGEDRLQVFNIFEEANTFGNAYDELKSRAEKMIERIEACENYNSEDEASEVAWMRAALAIIERGNLSSETAALVESWVKNSETFQDEMEAANA